MHCDGAPAAAADAAIRVRRARAAAPERTPRAITDPTNSFNRAPPHGSLLPPSFNVPLRGKVKSACAGSDRYGCYTENVKRRAHSRGAILLSGLLLGTCAAAEEKAPIERLMASSVCVIGEVPGGTFEASGFVVRPGDRVMTTAHSIAETSGLRVKLQDGRVFPARLVRLGNEHADLALLQLEGAKLPAVEFAGVRGLQPGDEVRTIGCPVGFEFSVTSGVVSSVRDSDLGYPLVQSDVAVNPGSSGGPLFDRQGRVVGIIKSAVKERERIHFALPGDLGAALLDQIDRDQSAYATFNQAVVEKDPVRKIALYRQAAKLQPGRFEAHYNLALALERLGKDDEAEAEYRAALGIVPASEPAALNLGALLYASKRYPEAIAFYQKALSNRPGSIALRNNLAEALRASGDRGKARREFEAVLKQNPSYAKAHYGLALLDDDERGDRRQAAAHYRRYLELAPDAADANQVREWLRSAEGSDKKP